MSVPHNNANDESFDSKVLNDVKKWELRVESSCAIESNSVYWKAIYLHWNFILRETEAQSAKGS